MPSTGRDTGYTSIEDRHTEEGAKVPVSKGRPKFLDPAQTLLNRKRIVDLTCRLSSGHSIIGNWPRVSRLRRRIC